MRRPRRWLAVLLSLLQPGLGHLYTGRILPAVLFAAVASLLAAPLAWLAIDADPRWGVVGVTVAVPMFLAIVAIHAGGTAGEPARRFGTRLRVAAACLAFVLAVGTTSALGDAVFRSWVAQAFRMPTAAMQPTLRIGDHFYVDAWYYRRTQPQRGEVVGFRIARDGAAMHPADRRSDLPLEILVKRIVGVPGDSIVLHGAILTVNGRVATGEADAFPFETESARAFPQRRETLGGHSYLVLDDTAQPSSPIPATVEPDRYFVAGDNRLNSNDSRYWGTVHRRDIIGRVSSIYWSWDFNGPSRDLLSPLVWFHLRDKVRWERIGLRVP